MSDPLQFAIAVSIAGSGWALAVVLLGWAAGDRRREVLRDQRLDALDARVARIELTNAPAAEPSPLTSEMARSGRHRDDPADRSAVAGPTLIAVPDLSTPPAESAEAAADLARRFRSIWELADSGAPPDAVARATGQPIGQVELILGLRRQLGGEGRRS